MTTETPLYIAETDELGRVVCVWFSEQPSSRPKPIRNPQKHLSRLAAAQCSGAAPDEIASWMEQRAR